MGVVATGSFIFSAVVIVVILKRKLSRKYAKSLLMSVGYYLYSRTRLGQWYFKRELAKAQKKYGGKPHSDTEPWNCNGIVIHPIPYADDNYCYLVIDELDGVSVLIDPADPKAIQPILDEKRLSPVAVLATHKHWDHSAGNEEWRKRYPRINIFGGIRESVPAVTDYVSDGDRLTFGRLHITAFSTPGHTAGHMVYVLDGVGSPSSLFSGDLLFVGGAGKMFEGDADTMLKSLDVVCNLPGDTLLWPGHEYSLTNLRFASSLEQQNVDLLAKLRFVEDKRRSRQCTIPSTIDDEKKYNPFLRTREPNLLSAVNVNAEGLVSDQLRAVALRECRARKDAFKDPSN